MNSQDPVRTCVGCRQRAAAAELLRVVVAPESSGQVVSVVPDSSRRLPGRGAWLHPDPRCVELAERRRAYARALRTPARVDPTPVGEYVARLGPHRQRSTAGDEQRMDKR